MAQPQPQATPRAFSPPQHAPSPAPPQAAYTLPPNKRVRTDGPPPSQPASPYPPSPYAASPAAATPPMNVASPSFSSTPPVAPYTNGNTAAGLSLPGARGPSTPPVVVTPQPAPAAAPIYTTATMAPIPATAPPPPMPAANAMGPPQRPAERPTKDYEYDVTDSLAGTGIDLRAEEQYMSELFSNALDTSTDARTGFAHYPPGGKGSFYGAGPANQPYGSAASQNQEQLAAKAAEQAWVESSMRLAVQKTQEVSDPFLLVALLHRRAEKIAREHNIGLNLEMKNAGQGKMRPPEQFPVPTVTVRTKPGPDATLVETTGSFIPHDCCLADQLALMSIATKQRVRELVEEANTVAINRQKTAHGEVPEEWASAAAPMNMENLDPMDWAGEGSPRSSKRSSGDANLGDEAAPPAKKLPRISSIMTVSMRDRARQEREWEEARLRKRQRRKEGGADAGATNSRAGSVAPGTPGSMAPESEKTMTKKEMKKSQALKAAEANSHANQNLTSSMFAGLGGKGGLFGKKKTGKTYDWMNVGRTGGGGTSTSSRATPGPKGPNGTATGSVAAGHSLTTEGRNRLGTWREDRDKGKMIQLRDWVTVLERDGREAKALSCAYVRLDTAYPK
ncbi:hypothetical protein CDD80_7425 [Ophiocordyceps camponoti-rufipedis]|uniref:Transcription initiation factor TFIID subunit 4 n=1 Tax=Ophiocordyceps camponoti-rufipedis TaxID=2004952 RepID=A0A2C5Z889_9HYPO|nr:hypothetical protein CDD80_7425 [Ophiocordyceps camponoti-rufipedis]